MYYLFEFDINELDIKELNTMVKINSGNMCHHDAKILKKLFKIYNVNDLYHIEARFEIGYLEITPNKIEKIMPRKFGLDVQSDSISFFHGYTKNQVYLENESNKYDGEKKIIPKNYFNEIKKIMKKINYIVNCDDLIKLT
ncbi:uncharacterized protein VNE69_10051 [Vairimorpha necatrix]|uniref:Uncharacterized protein n=1 Tax=Vairimorpha necatrix TaxID=6039 RepID=A0AAX4JFC5_9MICR